MHIIKMAENYDLKPKTPVGPGPLFDKGFQQGQGPLKGYLYEGQMAKCMEAHVLQKIASQSLPKGTSVVVPGPTAGAICCQPDCILVEGVVDPNKKVELVVSGTTLCGIELKTSQGADFGQFAIEGVLGQGPVDGTDANQLLTLTPRWQVAPGSVTGRENPEWVGLLLASLLADPGGMKNWKLNQIAMMLQYQLQKSIGKFSDSKCYTYLRHNGSNFQQEEQFYLEKPGDRKGAAVGGGTPENELLGDGRYYNIKRVRIIGDNYWTYILKGMRGCYIPHGRITYNALMRWLKRTQSEVWDTPWMFDEGNGELLVDYEDGTRTGNTGWFMLQVLKEALKGGGISEGVIRKRLKDHLAEKQLDTTDWTNLKKWMEIEKVSQSFAKALSEKLWDINKHAAMGSAEVEMKVLSEMGGETPPFDTKAKEDKYKRRMGFWSRTVAEQYQRDLFCSALTLDTACVLCENATTIPKGQALRAVAEGCVGFNPNTDTCQNIASACCKSSLMQDFGIPSGQSPEALLDIPVKAAAPYYLMKDCQFLQIGTGGGEGLYTLGGPMQIMHNKITYSIPSFYDSMGDVPKLRLRLKASNNFFGLHDFKVAIKLTLDRAQGMQKFPPGATGLNLNIAQHRNAFLDEVSDAYLHDKVFVVEYNPTVIPYPFQMGTVSVAQVGAHVKDIRDAARHVAQTALADMLKTKAAGKMPGGGRRARKKHKSRRRRKRCRTKHNGKNVKDAKKHADDAENVAVHADIKVFVLYICLKIHERIVVSIN